MSTSTTYIDRLERELLGAIGRRRRKRTVVTRLAAIAALASAVVATLVLTESGSSPALAIDLTGRPTDRSEVVLFVVSSPTPSYWRLTALGDFNGTRWTPYAETEAASGPVPPACEAKVDGETVTQTFEIRNLGGPWLPTAFAPVRVDDPDGITVDAETSSLVTEAGATDGLSYTVESVLCDYDPARLRAADAPPVGLDRYLALPPDFPAALADEARAIAAGASTRYDRAIALQNWFRDNFTYDRSFRGHGVNAMKEFLAKRRGYCEQFAGTYAAFARVVGLPSRVAVGFTQGEQRNDGRYYVQGKHAHAWPEIYFDGVGWVPYEPTPGRANPAAESTPE